MHILSPHQRSSLFPDAIQAMYQKKMKCPNHHMKDYVLKTIQTHVFSKAGEVTAVFWIQEV